MKKIFLAISLGMMTQIIGMSFDDNQRKYQLAVVIKRLLDGRRYPDAVTPFKVSQFFYNNRGEEDRQLSMEEYFNKRFHATFVNGMIKEDEFKQEAYRLISQAQKAGLVLAWAPEQNAYQNISVIDAQHDDDVDCSKMAPDQLYFHTVGRLKDFVEEHLDKENSNT